MSNTGFVRNLLVEQRKRTVATLMRYIEDEIYSSLEPDLRAQLRANVMGSINGYHDLCLDVLKASVNDGVVVNEEALEALTRIHQSLAAIQASVDRD